MKELRLGISDKNVDILSLKDREFIGVFLHHDIAA